MNNPTQDELDIARLYADLSKYTTSEKLIFKEGFIQGYALCKEFYQDALKDRLGA